MGNFGNKFESILKNLDLEKGKRLERQQDQELENKIKEQIDLLSKKWDELCKYESDLQLRTKKIEEKEVFLKKNTAAYEALENRVLADKCSLEDDKRKLKIDRADYDHQIKFYNEQLSRIKKRENQLLEEEAKLQKAQAKLEDAKLQMDLKLAAEVNERQAAYLGKLQEEHQKNIEASMNFVEQMHISMMKERDDAFSNLKNELNEEKERRLAEIASEVDKQEKAYLEKKQMLEKDQEEADKLKQECMHEKARLEMQFEILEERRQEVEDKYNNIENEIANRYEREINSYDRKIEALNNQLDDMQAECDSFFEEVETYKKWEDTYGDNPKIIENEIAKLKKENKAMADELAVRPESSVHEELCKLKLDYSKVVAEKAELEDKNRQYEIDRQKYASLEIEKDGYRGQVELLRQQRDERDNIIKYQEDKIKRLSAPDAREADRKERVKEIAIGYYQNVENPTTSLGQPENEVAWLKRISENCTKYGLKFDDRILYAFHTALKISDWSIITVLAGVSGTGKSELPRLYAKMGRMNFLSVAVQPNWDSQESMLGFFNSIDNKFDAQPVLKFLAQCAGGEKNTGSNQDSTEVQQNVLDNCVNIVLLDEMNLAHVEYYFAEFLSKLEQRRGVPKTNLPSIEVKLGAGVTPYKLQLTRNVLWCGTMNQDETTKSLSDKVLDRGQVINFPRPRTFVERTKMENIDSFVKKNLGNEPMLSYHTWRKWIKTDVKFIGDQGERIKKYKNIVEEINDILAKEGRALGHRVWQSIEFYIANYPTVIDNQEGLNDGELTVYLAEAMKTAFEDQLVQKVMPKLRGIDTRGPSRERLDAIRDLLLREGFDLYEDFEYACSLGYGQFMWSSAEYIGKASKESKDSEIFSANEASDEIEQVEMENK